MLFKVYCLHEDIVIFIFDKRKFILTDKDGELMNLLRSASRTIELIMMIFVSLADN